ncbi:MAG: hypothetical protein M4579_000113 [Chaenotheca gracillima]|nr:MAG: hypothetical protein M4579_000113 [Chaenotheca gracillima]
MQSTIRQATRAVRPARLSSVASKRNGLPRPFSSSAALATPPSNSLDDPPRGFDPRVPSRGPPGPPAVEAEHLKDGHEVATFLGTTKRIPEFNLADKVILVSGAARGLGVTQAEALLEAGATGEFETPLPCALQSQRRQEGEGKWRPSEEFFRVQKRAAEELGTTFHYRRIDVRDTENLNAIIENIGNTHGRLDGLLHCAGIQQETTALEYTREDCNTMMEVNITGTFMTAQAAAKQMIRFGNGGSIALIASMSGTVANRGLICPAYNASKAGVIQLARNLASEWGEYGIRVNTISPGYIVTAMVEELFKKFPERRTDWPKQNMLGKLSKPEDYRGAAVFLLSGSSRFMTGSDLRMDGGHSAW